VNSGPALRWCAFKSLSEMTLKTDCVVSLEADCVVSGGSGANILLTYSGKNDMTRGISKQRCRYSV